MCSDSHRLHHPPDRVALKSGLSSLRYVLRRHSLLEKRTSVLVGVSGGIDSLVLGCTHYPVLKGVISTVLGENIKLIDSAEVITEKVYSILQSLGWLNDSRIAGSQPDEFFVTDFPDRFKKVGEIFLNREIEKVHTAII